MNTIEFDCFCGKRLLADRVMPDNAAAVAVFYAREEIDHPIAVCPNCLREYPTMPWEDFLDKLGRGWP